MLLAGRGPAGEYVSSVYLCFSIFDKFSEGGLHNKLRPTETFKDTPTFVTIAKLRL
jgi:hypothetical protein